MDRSVVWGNDISSLSLFFPSVIILAFVKSEGKKPVKIHTTEKAPSEEEEPLLGDHSKSLEGSLRARVVS